jgi:hypothetical protein
MIFTKLLILILLRNPVIFGNIHEAGRVSDPVTTYATTIDNFCSTFFSLLRSEVEKPDSEVFKKALTGFLNLKAENKIKKNILTIIDFSISCNLDRMWIIDVGKMEVLHLSLVAHGVKSGVEYASQFSNVPSSLQSSLGFYLTGETFYSKHGLSLSLDGVEPGINDKARERGIIMHGANYVSRDFINRYGVLGRSFGCPAIPMDDHEKFISLLSNKSCIYIHYPDNKYESSSHMFSAETALHGMSILLSELTGVFDFGYEMN